MDDVWSKSREELVYTCAPFIGPVSIQKYLPTGEIEQVLCDGEDYDGARPCHYEWVKALHDECREYNTTFVFCNLGSCFVKDGKTYHYIQTSYADVDGSYEMEYIYSNGVERVILIEEGVQTDETEEITEYEARESVRAVLDQYVYDIADVKNVTVSEDDDGYTVLELKYDNVTGRYVLDGLTLVKCELTATYQGSYRGERHNYKINVTLENMGAK